MNRLNNSTSKNLPQNGNILDGFKALQSLIPVNDGTRSFTQLSADAYDNPCPISSINTETTLNITHAGHDISQINDSFLVVTQDVTIQIPQLSATAFPTSGSPTTTPTYFFGVKSSNQLIRQMKVIHNGKPTDYLSQECVREGYAFSNLKGASEKRGKKGIHTTYENVSRFSPEVCGVYIPVSEFKNGNKSATIRMKSLIPISDLLPFQTFSIYPSNLIGQLALKVLFSNSSFVWCQVPPEAVLEATNYMNNTTDALAETFSPQVAYDRFFHQIGDAGYACDYITNAYSCVQITPIIQSFSVTQFRSQLMGFGVQHETLQGISQFLSQGIVLPAQQLDYYSYSTLANSGGLDTSMQILYDNVESVSLMFPTTVNQQTCFYNPNVTNLQMTIDGKQFPPNAVSTNVEESPEFLVFQLNASDLDGTIEPTKSWLYSITQPRHNASGVRLLNTIHDNSDFMCNFSLERSQGGHVFDGFSTVAPVNTKLKFTPLFTGNNDVYYIPDPANPTAHPPAPQLWLCRDTFWVLKNGSIQYVNRGSPR